ncbi:MAG: hypothetical protein CM15mP68_4400 [Pseudomonadota bacterium]|nr:MAG: hypothetical protein CM15mP68_4400 [Pseudomonadota bacterium]
MAPGAHQRHLSRFKLKGISRPLIGPRARGSEDKIGQINPGPKRYGQPQEIGKGPLFPCSAINVLRESTHCRWMAACLFAPLGFPKSNGRLKKPQLETHHSVPPLRQCRSSPSVCGTIAIKIPGGSAGCTELIFLAGNPAIRPHPCTT